MKLIFLKSCPPLPIRGGRVFKDSPTKPAIMVQGFFHAIEPTHEIVTARSGINPVPSGMDAVDH